MFDLKVIYSQTSTTWVNIHDLFRIIEITDSYIKFIWASEESGFRHLYLITSKINQNSTNNEHKNDDGAKFFNGDKKENDFYNTIHHLDDDSELLTPIILEKKMLTSGEWEVASKNIWIDKQHEIIYFLGLRETPLEKHLYAVSLKQPNYVRLLTEKGYSFTVDFNEVSCYMFFFIFVLCI